MEKTMVNVAWLRQKMAREGVTQYDLGREAHLPQSTVSRILNGKEYLGPERSRRIREAILRLSVDTTKAKPPSDTPPEPRVRKL